MAKNFNSGNKKLGKRFEIKVHRQYEMMIPKPKLIISEGPELILPHIGISLDRKIILHDDRIIGVETKAGKNGGMGGCRTDNVKKAICDGAIVKYFYPDWMFHLWFSHIPKSKNSSDRMLEIAKEAGFVDYVGYLALEDEDLIDVSKFLVDESD